MAGKCGLNNVLSLLVAKLSWFNCGHSRMYGIPYGIERGDCSPLEHMSLNSFKKHITYNNAKSSNKNLSLELNRAPTQASDYCNGLLKENFGS